MKWLWKNENPDLPTNFGLAYRCLESLLSRFQNEQGLENLEKIDKTIKEQAKNGVIEQAFKRKDELEYYLPHHPVFKGEKIREVYNASARTRGRKSLNDHVSRSVKITRSRWNDYAIQVVKISFISRYRESLLAN